MHICRLHLLQTMKFVAIFPIAHSPSAAMSIGSYGNEQEDSQEYESEVEMQCDSHGMVVLGMGLNIYAHLSSSSTLDNKVCCMFFL